jgi:hypothetical protein
MQEQRKNNSRLPCFHIFFAWGGFFLNGKFFRRKNEMFFESGGKVSANIAVKCLGTRCESGAVAPL